MSTNVVKTVLTGQAPITGTTITTTTTNDSYSITPASTEAAPPVGMEEFHSVLSRVDEGDKWLVRVLKFGTSKNGWDWGKESAASLMPLLEHAPVGYYAYPNGYAAHMTDEAATAAKGVPLRNMVADLSNPQVREDGVYADLTVHEDASWLRQKLENFDARGVLDKVIGLSVDTLADVAHKAIKSVRELRSVDIVTAPSADGRFVRAVAGLQWPDITASASERHSEVLPMADETTTTKGPTAAELAAVREAEQAAAKSKQDAEADRTEAKTLREAAAADAAAIRQTRAELDLIASDARVREAVSAANLPEPIKAKLVKQMVGTVQTPEGITARIKEDADAWAAIAATAGVKGFGGGDVHIEMGPEEADKKQAALDRLFGHKRDDFHKVLESAPMTEAGRAKVREAHRAADEAARGDAGLAFTSIKQAYIAFTGDTGMTGRVRMSRRLTEAQVVTTTWGDALGNTLYRRLVAAYAEPVYNEQTISRFGSAPDFRTREVAHLGYFADLPQVAENVAYQEIGIPSDEKVTYSITKYGSLLPITMETIANDDLRVVQETVARLGRGARRTLAQAIWSPWINNSTWDVDGNVWFKNSTNRSAATGGNTGSTLLVGAATLTMANEVLAKVQQLGLMTERTSGKRLGVPQLTALWLDGPIDCMGTIWQLNQAREFGTGNVNPILGLFGSNNERININPLLTDTSNWGIHVDPRVGGRESVGCDFYQGREEPLLELQDMRTVGDVFLYDRIAYKISHIFGVDLIDVYGAASNRHL